MPKADEVPSNRARQLKKERQQLQRKRAARDAVARETQMQQAMAAATQDWSRRRRRHAIAYTLYAVAAVMAIAHFFEHADTFNVMSPALADLLIGWPMAGLLAFIGAIIYGR
jgi:hypothetical protein